MRWRTKRSWKPSYLSLQREKMLVSRLNLQVLISVSTLKPVNCAKKIQLSKEAPCNKELLCLSNYSASDQVSPVLI